MEHIFFEVQLCIEMLIFKETHVFPILIILCLVTGLKDVWNSLPVFFILVDSCPSEGFPAWQTSH